MLITDARGATWSGGDLGAATTPGTGFGVVTANLGEPTQERCAQLGDALARAYAGTSLPDGTEGALDHLIFR